MLKFQLKDISIYLTALIFIEGLLTFTAIMRNYFSSQYGVLIFKKDYLENAVLCIEKALEEYKKSF